MLNLFRQALTPQCPEMILETVVISFFSVLHSSNHGLRKTLGRMECKNLPVSATSQLFCHSSNILCFVTGSKSRATDSALYNILPEVASKSALSFPAIPTSADTHMKLSSRPLRASCQHFCLHSYTNGWVCSKIFRDSIALAHIVGQDSGIRFSLLRRNGQDTHFLLEIPMGLMGSTPNNSLGVLSGILISDTLSILFR
jgi:hypothetical protein